MSIRVGIYGYGNVGKGAEAAINQNPDLELVAIFSRRDAASVIDSRKKAGFATPVAVWPADEDSLKAHANAVDVLLLCGGSATDLPIQTPL